MTYVRLPDEPRPVIHPSLHPVEAEKRPMWSERPDSFVGDADGRSLTPLPSGVTEAREHLRPVSVVPFPDKDSLRHNVNCRTIPVSTLSSMPPRKPLKGTAAYEKFAEPAAPPAARLPSPMGGDARRGNRLSAMFLSVFPSHASRPSTPIDSDFSSAANKRKSRLSTFFGRPDAPPSMRAVSMYVPNDTVWTDKDGCPTPTMTVRPHEETEEEIEDRRGREQPCAWLCY